MYSGTVYTSPGTMRMMKIPLETTFLPLKVKRVSAKPAMAAMMTQMTVVTTETRTLF